MSPVRIAHGTGRYAFVGDRWTVKVPRPSAELRRTWPHRGRLWRAVHGYLANVSEVEWSGAPGVNPVVASLFGGLVTVYRTAQVCRDEPDQWPPVAPGLTPEPEARNVGWVDGELLWLDYDSSGTDTKRSFADAARAATLAADAALDAAETAETAAQVLEMVRLDGADPVAYEPPLASFSGRVVPAEDVMTALALAPWRIAAGWLLPGVATARSGAPVARSAATTPNPAPTEGR